MTRPMKQITHQLAAVCRPAAHGVLALTMLAPPAFAEPAPDAVPGAAATAPSEDEDSILVSSRAEPLAEGKTPTESDETLEPISTISKYSPEPAGPKPESEAADAADTQAAAGDLSDIAVAYEAKPKRGRVSFQQIIPGKATKADLDTKWGKASGVSSTDTGEVLLYDFEQFARVDVLVEKDTVEIIRVELADKQSVDTLAKRLMTDGVESVEVIDPKTGEALAVAYPEKGMMMLLAESPAITAPAEQQLVTHLVIGRLDAEAFALRAEQQADEAIAKKLADLTTAIEINDAYSVAHYQLAELYLATGQVESAVAAAQKAVDAEPDNSAYRLRLAQAWLEQGEYDKSVLEARAVLDAEKADTVVKADALRTMGRLASLGDVNISDKAIAFHTMAISVADKLATSADDKDRRAAKRLLIESHLDVAKEVSRRNYERKTEVVAQWIGRASGLAEEMISNDGGSVELRLVVARDALASLANLKPTKDPMPWINEAEEAAKALRAESEDTMLNARVAWLLGEAYYHAVRIEHTRAQPSKALTYGKTAIKHLMEGAATGDIRPAAEMLVGRLYFHMGAVNAVHLQDHEQAVSWYERSEPLLKSEPPKSTLLVPRRKGEALVSMAVSFWNEGDQDRAVNLTLAGAELMEQAVKAGVLGEKSLGVPYGNLATMHRKLGDDQKASRYARLARGARGVATASRPSGPTSGSSSETKPAGSTGKASGRSADKSRSGSVVR